MKRLCKAYLEVVPFGGMDCSWNQKFESDAAFDRGRRRRRHLVWEKKKIGFSPRPPTIENLARLWSFVLKLFQQKRLLMKWADILLALKTQKYRKLIKSLSQILVIE